MVDNFFKECPPKMSDGRFITDFRSSVRREEYIKYINNIVRDDEFRMFLQKNSDIIIDGEWNYYKKNNSCPASECIHNYPTRVYPPWLVEQRIKYDSLRNPKRTVKFPCEVLNDYRMSDTSGTKY